MKKEFVPIPRVTVLVPGGGKLEFLGGVLPTSQPPHYRIEVPAEGKVYLVPAASVIVLDEVAPPVPPIHHPPGEEV